MLSSSQHLGCRVNRLGDQIMESQIGTRHIQRLDDPRVNELTGLVAALRHELDAIHTYDFVEGTIQAPLAPGKLWIRCQKRSLKRMQG